MTNTQLVEKSKSRVGVVEEIDGAVGVDTHLVEEELSSFLKYITVILSDAKIIHTTKAHMHVWERYLTVILLCASDRGQSGRCLKQELNNDALKSQPKFPSTLAKALAMINDYSALVPMPQLTDGYDGEGVAFPQKGEGAAFV